MNVILVSARMRAVTVGPEVDGKSSKIVNGLDSEKGIIGYFLLDFLIQQPIFQDHMLDKRCPK